MGDGLTAVAVHDDILPFAAVENLINNGIARLGTWIVIGQDHMVRQSSSNGTHLRSFAAIPIPATAKHHP